MARPKTKRSAGKPIGVAERLADAPPSNYRWRGKPLPAEYTVAGVTHKTDGTCHDECEDVR